MAHAKEKIARSLNDGRNLDLFLRFFTGGFFEVFFFPAIMILSPIIFIGLSMEVVYKTNVRRG
jgi:hypothetical protein